MAEAYRLSIRSDDASPRRRRASRREVLVVVGTALAALGLLVSGAAALVADNLVVPVTWTTEQTAAADGALLLGGVTTSTLTIAEPTGLQRFLVFAPAAVLCATAVVCGLLLRKIVRSMEAGDTFHRDNPRRVATLGAAVLAGGVVGAAITTVGRITALQPSTLGLEAPGGAVGPLAGAVEIPVTALAVAATLWVIAAVLRRGTAMHSDLQGLV